MRFALSLAAFALVVAVGPGWAEDTAEDAAYKAITEIVRFTPPAAEAKPCAVEATADFSKYADRIDVFRNAFLNKEYPVDFYKQRQRQVFAYIVPQKSPHFLGTRFARGFDGLGRPPR